MHNSSLPPSMFSHTRDQDPRVAKKPAIDGL